MSTMSAAMRLASTAEAGEIETWAAASAAASLSPSPTIRTLRPCGAQVGRGGRPFPAGGAAGDQSAMPTAAASARDRAVGVAGEERDRQAGGAEGGDGGLGRAGAGLVGEDEGDGAPVPPTRR